MESHSITLSEQDYSRLTALVDANISAAAAESLEEELERASVLPMNKMPNDTVRMFSTVHYKNLDSGATSTVTIVYPAEANVAASKVSVLAPIGAALIGLQVGQTIDWALPNGKTARLQVVEVTHQEEEGEQVQPS